MPPIRFPASLNSRRFRSARASRVLLFASLLAASVQGLDASEPSSTRPTDASGGLYVQIGGDVSAAADMARTGRFLAHVLLDAEKVAPARRQLAVEGLYGMASVDRRPTDGSLPYTENLVNLILVGSSAPAPAAEELFRVLCPDGRVLAAPRTLSAEQLSAAGFEDVREIRRGPGWIAARKPRPAEMDQWSHPRHGADGNAVSRDTLVSPPRRIRWVVGALRELSGMVSAGGRNFYAGVLARDSYNGLRLWDRKLSPSPSEAGLVSMTPPGGALPVAGAGRLFVFTDGKLQALDGATGRPERQFPDAGRPQQLLYDDGTLIAVGRESLRAYDAVSGRPLWKQEASSPRCVVAGDALVGFIAGDARRGEKATVAVLDMASGRVRWRRDDFPWAAAASRCVYHQDVLAYEVSTLNNDGPGNALHLVSAKDGSPRLDHPFLPGMNHRRQARALFIGDRLWLLHGGRGAEEAREPIQVSAIDLQTGEADITYDAGLVHCFPQVATPRYLFSGEMDLTDLRSGKTDANRITKAACGRDRGWIPANGLIYVTPKHCVCWPMLRGYAALAGARPGGAIALDDEKTEALLETGVAAPDRAPATRDDDWPCYRHDAWRSGSTTSAAPDSLQTLWSADLGRVGVSGPIARDWEENPFVKGPMTAPVAAGGLVLVARPDAHEVVALHAATGRLQWRFTASGRVDTAPTLHRGLCLFGAKNGFVYCLRARDGRMVWRRRAAPVDERIVAYGQLESPWPVPGSVLVVDDTAYFAAGRQPLADGGIRVFAVDPASGQVRWDQVLDTLPQKGFYNSSAMEFDNFDLLHREGDCVAMSRWLFDRKTGRMSVEQWKAFARLNTGGGAAMVPQGCWSYAPRHQTRTLTHSPRRPLVVFRDNVLWGCGQEKRSIYRREFNLDGGETFDTKWITGWEASSASREDGEAWRSQRLAKKAKWSVPIYDEKKDSPTIDALLLADDKLLVAGSSGELRVLSAADGRLLDRREIPIPLWDGLALAAGRLYLSTQDGHLLCLGEKGR